MVIEQMKAKVEVTRSFERKKGAKKRYRMGVAPVNQSKKKKKTNQQEKGEKSKTDL